MSFDLKSLVNIDMFKTECLKSPNIKLTIDDVTYKCSVQKSYYGNDIQCSFYCDNDHNFFMKLTTDGTGSVNTLCVFTELEGAKKGVEPKKNYKLETIFYIRTFFYRMLGIEKIKITDAASGRCDNGIKYSLLNYRIFATDKPLNELSIYTKFYKKKFTYIHDHFNKDILNKMLDKYREKSTVKAFERTSPVCETEKNKISAIIEKLDQEEFDNFTEQVGEYIVENADSTYFEKVDSNFKSKSKSKSKSKKKSKLMKSKKTKYKCLIQDFTKV